jgi:hypothetical protein
MIISRGSAKILDDVDLLAAELAHDGLHPGAAGPDAGADRIDLGIGGDDGDLGAVTGLAGEGLDLDGAVGDLGDLELEEAADKLRAAAAEDDLGAAGVLFSISSSRQRMRSPGWYSSPGTCSLPGMTASALPRSM